MTVERITRIIPVSQRMLDDAEVTREAVDRSIQREARRQERWTRLIAEAHGRRPVGDEVRWDSSVGMDATSPEYEAHLERATGLAQHLAKRRQQHAQRVLERYNLWRAYAHQHKARMAARVRLEEREATPVVPLTLESLLTRLGWPREYAEHVVQPYCECAPEPYDSGGWELCQHARDLGLTDYASEPGDQRQTWPEEEV